MGKDQQNENLFIVFYNWPFTMFRISATAPASAWCYYKHPPVFHGYVVYKWSALISMIQISLDNKQVRKYMCILRYKIKYLYSF